MRSRSWTRLTAAAVAAGVGLAATLTALPASAQAPQTGVAASAAASAVDPVVVDYQENDAVIVNPARGFYKHTETHSYVDGSGWTPLSAATLEGYRERGISQILRVVYLERYVDADLDAQLLDAVAADFATARSAGVSIILRFAYAQGGAWPYSPPYGDATLERVLGHISQLTPLLRENADVIAVMQSGFVGLWGEGYYTDNFVADPANPGVVTDEDWADRTAVVDALLAALPESRSVQLRTMLSKQKAFDRPTGAEGALTPAEAFTGEDVSRVGHHNDCFLASPDDYGTFLSDPISLDQDYLAAETRFVPMGGETCNVNPPRSEWPSASAEMAAYHYSYLNRDYNQAVLDTWGEEGLTETAKNLGYRFVLEQSRLNGGAEPSLEIDVRNEGWAAPYNPRPVSLVLEGTDGQVTVPLDVDARTWAPGTTSTVAADLSQVPAGEYRAYLALPAPEASIAGDPRFAIQTANVGTWVADRGLNDLQQTVVVQTDVDDTPVSISPPVVAGTPDVGSALTVSPGEWEGSDLTFAYQWLRDGSPIANATGEAYTATARDQGASLSVQVTATNEDGSASAVSNEVVVRYRSALLVTTDPFLVATSSRAVTVKVNAFPQTAAGEITVTVAGQTVTGTLSGGRASVDAGKLPRGIHPITVTYAGSDTVAPSVGRGAVIVLR